MRKSGSRRGINLGVVRVKGRVRNISTVENGFFKSALGNLPISRKESRKTTAWRLRIRILAIISSKANRL